MKYARGVKVLAPVTGSGLVASAAAGFCAVQEIGAMHVGMTVNGHMAVVQSTQSKYLNQHLGIRSIGNDGLAVNAQGSTYLSKLKSENTHF